MVESGHVLKQVQMTHFMSSGKEMITFHWSYREDVLLMDVLTFTSGPKGKLGFGDEKSGGKGKAIPGGQAA